MNDQILLWNYQALSNALTKVNVKITPVDVIWILMYLEDEDFNVAATSRS